MPHPERDLLGHYAGAGAVRGEGMTERVHIVVHTERFHCISTCGLPRVRPTSTDKTGQNTTFALYLKENYGTKEKTKQEI